MKNMRKMNLISFLLTVMLVISSFLPVSAIAEDAETSEDNPVVEVTEHGIEITKSCAEAIDNKMDLRMIDNVRVVLLDRDSLTLRLSEYVDIPEFKQIEYVNTVEAYSIEKNDSYMYILHFDPILTLRERAALVAEDPRVLTITPPMGYSVTDDVIPDTFSDDRFEAYYHYALVWAKNHSIAKGYSDHTFGVGRNCTRRDFMIFLWRMHGRPHADNASVPFNDMKDYNESSDTYKAVAWAVSRGIVRGYDDGAFRPLQAITRKDALIMMYRVNRPEVFTSVAFTDVSGVYPPSSDTYKAIAWAAGTGITKGYNGTLFKPLNHCLREDAIVFLYRHYCLLNIEPVPDHL